MRTLRPHSPGAFFHLTARCQGRARWLDEPLRHRIVHFVHDAFRRSAGRLLAYAIMPNHLHLIVQQTAEPLAATMQPLLRRVALLVQSTHDLEGHVFGRRFHATLCQLPSHTRNAIVYTHLNPVRAGLCEDPCDYPHSSAAAYLGRPCDTPPALLELATGLGLFADARPQGPITARAAYQAYMQWRIDLDAALKRATQAKQSLGDKAVALPPEPGTIAGDALWRERFESFVQPGTVRRPELNYLAGVLVEQAGPPMTVAMLRSGSRCIAVSRLRRTFILQARALGYRTGQLARFLRVADSCVSKVVTRSQPPLA